MIRALKPYPAYKPSGVEWLGDVPEHWQILRVKNLVQLKSGENITSFSIGESGQHPVYGGNGIRGYTSKYTHDGEFVLIGRQGALCGNINYARGKFWASEHALVAHARQPFDVYWLGEVLRTMNLNQYSLSAAQPGLAVERIENLWLPVPPLPEQSAIVRFLDHVDRRIRRYIRSKQKLITLLNEQKQAIIQRAVTRGLDPNVRLKPSGVEWLGDVPEHWTEVVLGRCLKRIDQGWSPVAAEGEISADQWAVLTLSAVKRGNFNAAAIKPVPLSSAVPEGIEVEDGDLLITRSNTRERVGDVCVVQGVRPRTVVSDLIYRLVVNPEVFDRRFLAYQLLSPLGRWQIERDARGSSGTMPKIAQRHIGAWKVLAPPMDEQRQIARAVDDQVIGINEAVRRAETENSLLREFHASLVANVVTGKLDVREAAAQLPVEDEELEPLDKTKALAEDNEGDDASLDGAPEEDET